MNGFPSRIESDEMADGRLSSVPNFRDVAGPGYQTPEGPMRRGVLFRSSKFQISPEELNRVSALGIETIYDLRIQREFERAPDSEIAGATWRHAGVPGLSSDDMSTIETGNDLREAMINHYRGFVENPAKRAGFATLLVGIAESPGPQLFHCAEGKDRTGWAAMLIQRLVGVSDADVVADFLLTNDRMDPRGLNAARAFFGDKPDEFIMPAMVADLAYLEAGVEQMEADYGDLITYLRSGLGLDDEQLSSLRDRFRV